MDRLALLRQGSRLIAAGDLAGSEASYRGILARLPDDAETLSNLAAVLSLRGEHVAAEQACRMAVRIDPGCGAAHGNLGLALHRQQRHDEAIAAYCAALRIHPGHVNACTNLGVALAEQWRMADALRIHAAAVQLAPNHAEIRYNRALALLMAGEFAEGFAEFEWRWRAQGMLPHGLSGPQWQGENLEGRRILVHDEGGFGDTLQFIRFVPGLVADRVEVLVRVQKPLLRLMQRSLPGVQVLTHGDAMPAFDVHCPMLSLPRALATTLDTIPGQAPYLMPDRAATARWQTRFVGRSTDLRVGLVWAGEPRPGSQMVHAMDGRRSAPLSAFAEFADLSGVRLISLQRGVAATMERPPGLCLWDPMAEMVDFADTAGLIANLDLVITVDTAVAHLAGGLGRPVWLMSRFDACWRWLAGRRDSPWYPGLRLYRQPKPGDWAAVIAEVAKDLRALANEKGRANGTPFVRQSDAYQVLEAPPHLPSFTL